MYCTLTVLLIDFEEYNLLELLTINDSDSYTNKLIECVAILDTFNNSSNEFIVFTRNILKYYTTEYVSFLLNAKDQQQKINDYKMRKDAFEAEVIRKKKDMNYQIKLIQKIKIGVEKENEETYQEEEPKSINAIFKEFKSMLYSHKISVQKEFIDEYNVFIQKIEQKHQDEVENLYIL